MHKYIYAQNHVHVDKYENKRQKSRTGTIKTQAKTITEGKTQRNSKYTIHTVSPPLPEYILSEIFTEAPLFSWQLLNKKLTICLYIQPQVLYISFCVKKNK